MSCRSCKAEAVGFDPDTRLRVVDGVEILAGILHPDVWAAPAPPVAARMP
jgi:hypothetical protein